MTVYEPPFLQAIGWYLPPEAGTNEPFIRQLVMTSVILSPQPRIPPAHPEKPEIVPEKTQSLKRFSFPSPPWPTMPPACPAAETATETVQPIIAFVEAFAHPPTSPAECMPPATEPETLRLRIVAPLIAPNKAPAASPAEMSTAIEWPPPSNVPLKGQLLAPAIVETLMSAASVTVMPLYESTPRFTRDANAFQSANEVMLVMQGLYTKGFNVMAPISFPVSFSTVTVPQLPLVPAPTLYGVPSL